MTGSWRFHEQEQKDLDELKAAIQAKELSTYYYMKSVLRYTEKDLEHSGYRGKTIAQALEMILRDSEKHIKKLHDAYIKKYPD